MSNYRLSKLIENFDTVKILRDKLFKKIHHMLTLIYKIIFTNCDEWFCDFSNPLFPFGKWKKITIAKFLFLQQIDIVELKFYPPTKQNCKNKRVIYIQLLG